LLDKAIPELCSAKGFERKYDMLLLVYTHIIIIFISISIIIIKENHDGLRPVVLIGTPAAKCALRSASILTALAQFAARAFLLAF
jgi:hypothetical protein